MLLPRAGAGWPMTQEPWQGLDGSQAAVLALCHPREGEERGRFAGSPARKEPGGRGRVEKSFSCESRETAVTTEGRGGGEWGPSLPETVSAESKHAVRNMRPFKIQ